MSPGSTLLSVLGWLPLEGERLAASHTVVAGCYNTCTLQAGYRVVKWGGESEHRARVTSRYKSYWIRGLSVFSAAGYNTVAMKVIFLKDVPNVARVGDMKVVADGYGRNYLLPHKLALLATPSAVKSVEIEVRKQRQQEARFAEELSHLAEQLEGFSITFQAKVVEEDRLYGSVRDADIAERLTELTGTEIEKRQIGLEEPIRHLGEHEVTVKLGKDLTPKVKVVVTPEE